MTPRDAEEIRSYTLKQSGGTAVAPHSTDAEIAMGQFEMLREIAAQLAIANEIARSKESKKPAAAKKAISSGARHTSNCKLFYVGVPWQLNMKEDAIYASAFTPHEGRKQLDDLAVDEYTEGTMGTLASIKITRRQ